MEMAWTLNVKDQGGKSKLLEVTLCNKLQILANIETLYKLLDDPFIILVTDS